MNNLGNSIAYCIITYNHPEIVKDVLNNSVELFVKYGVDIYFYDSSEKEDTYHVVNEFISKGFKNLYYVKLDSSVAPANKIIKIFSGYGLKKKYEYVWPAKDRSYFGEKVLMAVEDSVRNRYDAIFLGVVIHPLSEYRLTQVPEEYENIQQFFSDWSWLSTSIDVTIFRYDTLLEKTDFEELRNRYFFGEYGSFFHSAVLFHGLAAMEKPKIKVLSGEGIFCFNSRLGSSSWNAELFKLWADIMVKTFDALPNCYDIQKEAAIKKIGKLPWIFGSYDHMLYEREENVLTKQVCEDVKDVWSRVSDIPLSELKLIEEKNLSLLYQIMYGRMESLLERKQYYNFIELFCYNKWIESFLGDLNFYILKNCCHIFLIEKEANIENHIFTLSKTMEGMFELYNNMVQMLAYLLTSEDSTVVSKILTYKNAMNISMKYFAYLIINETSDSEIIMEKLQEFTND